MRKITRKKAQGHIEMIMSFGLFIGFVITMLFFFRPTVKSKEVSVGSVQTAILTNLSVESFYFSVSESAKTSCFCFTNPYPEASGNIIIRDRLRENVGGWINGNTICIEQNDNDFFYIFLSSAYDEASSGTCGNTISLDEEAVGSLRKSEAISNKALENLRDSYNKDYFTLVESLQTMHDFRFALFDNQGTNVMEVEKEPQLGRPVFSKDLPIEILFKDGETGRYILRLYAW